VIASNPLRATLHLIRTEKPASLGAPGGGALASMTLNSQNVTEIGQGGGMQGLSADYTPPSRFVRSVYLRQFADEPKTADEGVQSRCLRIT